jgi:hypothetical protein
VESDDEITVQLVGSHGEDMEGGGESAALLCSVWVAGSHCGQLG